MQVTRIRIRLEETHRREPKGVRGYADILLDDALSVHDIKVVETGDGRLMVSFPSRKRTFRCGRCESKITYLSRFCPQCGVAQSAADREPPVVDGRRQGFADVVHPIDDASRRYLVGVILDAYADELERVEADSRTEAATAYRASA